MTDCNDKKNPLQRNGSSQADRKLPAMHVDYVKVDERSFAAWIVFAGEYTKLLHYYDKNYTKQGDWSVFFTSDATAVLGTIALQDVNQYKTLIKNSLDFLRDENNASKLNEAKQNLFQLFSIAFSLAASIDHYYKLLPDGHAYKATIENLVKSIVAPAFRRLVSYYKPCVLPEGAPQKSLLATIDLTTVSVLGRQAIQAGQVVEDGLSRLWWMQQPDWATYFAGISADESIYGTEPDAFRQLMYVANHNLFTGAFDSLLMSFSRLVTTAEKELLVSLEKRNTHPSHYTLFLAFLQLFRTAQNDINTITRRHLDFYYRDILQLKLKAAEPNFAHIIAELSRPAMDAILAKDSLLKAGKDSGGKDVSYGLDKQTAFNKATVADLRAIYIGEPNDDAPGSKNDGRVFAAPVINSSDGLGAGLRTPNKEWHPIANRLYSEGDVFSIEMPEAELGFAIASHYLFLQEGERTVKLRLVTSNSNLLTTTPFAVYLTTEKEWYLVPGQPNIAAGSMNTTKENCAEISFTLAGDAPAIVNYNAEVHGGNLGIALPVVKLILEQNPEEYYPYNALRNITLSRYEVEVQVGGMNGYNQSGVKQLYISTDAGAVDTSKPFMPFGPMPRKDATMVIGSKEVFSKKNAKIKLELEWAGLPGSYWDMQYNTRYGSTYHSDTGKYTYWDIRSDTPYYPKVKTQFLVNGAWTSVIEGSTQTSPADIFNYNIEQFEVYASTLALNPKSISDYEDESPGLNQKSVCGFMRWVLDGDMGHKKYLQDTTKFLIEKSKSEYYTKEVGVMPIEPYTPVLQSLYLSYSACSDVVELSANNEVSFKQKPASLYHLYPFGHLEQHAFISGASTHYLLPQFRQYHTEQGKDILHQGEFYIGFKNLSGQQAVQVLFQVMDGTADPTLNIPKEHIGWSYLAGNEWVSFTKQEINDGTRQLIQSGIISFTIPEGATTAHSLLPSGLLWIRASVENKVDGICKLLSVQAQAAITSFRNKENAGDFLEKALAAGSISKLKEPQSAIKKITQPYASFGGRPLEKPDAFYIRVSERLRHKSRAITIWDYEHLILEAFPLIHKVKCLNHTKSDDTGYNEVLPGHVTIITIPDLRQRNDINPLKPYTSQAMLDEIREFLKARISCHVNLHVVNPDFEEVKLKFQLRLAKGYDDFTIYAKQLKQEITDFLSPWATGKGDISFGGAIHKSVLINFIEERPYVDFITDVKMAHYDAEKSLVSPDNDTIQALYAKSILVSVPASKHEIEEYPDDLLNDTDDCENHKKDEQPMKANQV